jgi:hypothetical protein
MTIAEFYRSEAARCERRAEKSSTAERAIRWKALVKEYLQQATEFSAAENRIDGLQDGIAA